MSGYWRDKTEVSVHLHPMDLTGMQSRFQAHREAILARFAQVVDHGRFVLGPEVAELEMALAKWLEQPALASLVSSMATSTASLISSPHPQNLGHHPLHTNPLQPNPLQVITCASGTDALRLALMALDIGPGHAVVLPAFGFAAAAEAVILAGGKPIFADIDPLTFNLDPQDVATRLRNLPEGSPIPKAMIAIDTFGLPADYHGLRQVANAFGLFLVEDAAQSMGAAYHGQKAGTQADIAITSFYPTKTLGCMGDGGALFTRHSEWANRLRLLRDHGQTGKYWHQVPGLNSRLDSLQAAVLLEMLPGLAEEVQARSIIAKHYRETLFAVNGQATGASRRIQCPTEPEETVSAWSSFTILCANRDRLRDHLQTFGIPTACHYPRLLPESPAFSTDATKAETKSQADLGNLFSLESLFQQQFPQAFRISRQCLSLPIHGDLTLPEQDRVMEAMHTWCAQGTAVGCA